MVSLLQRMEKQQVVVEEAEETILGSFSDSADPKKAQFSYHIFVTSRRLMGIKVKGKIPTSANELENPNNIIDFSIPRGAISKITMRNLGKYRNVFVVQIRGGRALKILLRHSSDKEFQKEKELLIDGFRR
jgi:hypothetical protein